MKRKVKGNVIELIEIIKEAFEYIPNSGDEYVEILQESENAIDSIISILESEKEADLIVPALKQIKEDYVKGCETVSTWEMLCEHIEKTATDIRNAEAKIREIKEDRLKIVFLPYKYSMWDSMESVWYAAKEDKEIEAHILPIPYYDKTSEGTLDKMHWERKSYPMETKDYRVYKLEDEKPDVIIIHNPYDQANKVTSIHPDFYIDRLKAAGAMVVYLPYKLAAGRSMSMETYLAYCFMPGMCKSDLIILPSEEIRDVYGECGIPSNKMRVLGSPKIDAIVKPKNKINIPTAWQKKMENKRVVLLNTNINGVLNNKDWVKRNGKYILEKLLSSENLCIIWRPHPLLEATLSGVSKGEYEYFHHLIKEARQSNSVIYDDTDDIIRAMVISDMLLSDPSSIMGQYIFTGKPLYKLDSDDNMNIRISYNNVEYLIHNEDDAEDILLTLLNQNMSKSHMLWQAYKDKIPNLDGSCGEAIIKELKDIIDCPVEV